MSDDDKNRLKHAKPKVGKDLAFESEVDSKQLQEIEASVRADKALVERGKLDEREELDDRSKGSAGVPADGDAFPKADIPDKEKDKRKEKSERAQRLDHFSDKKQQLEAPKADRLQKDASEASLHKAADVRTSEITSENELKETEKGLSKERQYLETKFDPPAIENRKEVKLKPIERSTEERVEKKDLERERVSEEKSELSGHLLKTENFSKQESKSVQIEKLDYFLPALEQVEVSHEIFQELKPLEIYIAARQDLEMVELVRQYAEVKPYEAVQNLEVAERPNLSIEKEQQVPVRGIEYEPELPKVQEALERKGITGIHCDNEAFGMIVPVPVGLKLAELGTLEPETMEFLHEKFGYLQDLVPQSQLEKISGQESVNTLREAVEHGRKEMKPRRTNSSRQARAEKQIEVIQEELWVSSASPRYMDYMYTISKCDCRDGYYVYWSSQIVGYETIWHCIQSRRFKEKEPERLSDRDDLDRDDSER